MTLLLPTRKKHYKSTDLHQAGHNIVTYTIDILCVCVYIYYTTGVSELINMYVIYILYIYTHTHCVPNYYANDFFSDFPKVSTVIIISKLPAT